VGGDFSVHFSTAFPLERSAYLSTNTQPIYTNLSNQLSQIIDTFRKPVNVSPKSPRKQKNPWIIVLGVLLVVACGCVAIAYFIGVTGGSVNPLASLPPHSVNDLYDNGNMVDYYIVVNKSFTKDNAGDLTV